MDASGDPHDLGRFVQAQEGDYARALAEVRGGRKRSHWMWYVFPQVEGLGSSATTSPSGAGPDKLSGTRSPQYPATTSSVAPARTPAATGEKQRQDDTAHG